MSEITDPAIEAYATTHTSAEPPLLVELAEATREFSSAHGMMVGRLEGRFLKMLVAISGARRVLEIGTFTGYSALSMAEALPPDGNITTLEVDERHAAMAREHIARSPHADRIGVRVGPALATLAELDGPFDFVFIDAAKVEYPAYFDAVFPKVRSGGLICIDNVFQSGRVLDEREQGEGVVAVRRLNERIAADAGVESVMVPIRDGVTIVRKP